MSSSLNTLCLLATITIIAAFFIQQSDGCPPACFACSSTSVCTTCNGLYGLTSTNQCNACSNNAGCKNCTVMTQCTECINLNAAPNKDNSGTCSPCSANCQSCMTNGPGLCDQGKCTFMAIGSGFRYNNVTKMCEQCLVDNCTTCNTNLNQCDVCNSGSAPLVGTNRTVCSACSPHCGPVCTKNGGTFCDYGKCLSPYGLNNATKLCESCGTYCTKCSINGAGLCDSQAACQNGSIFDNSTLQCGFTTSTVTSTTAITTTTTAPTTTTTNPTTTTTARTSTTAPPTTTTTVKLTTSTVPPTTTTVPTTTKAPTTTTAAPTTTTKPMTTTTKTPTTTTAAQTTTTKLPTTTTKIPTTTSTARTTTAAITTTVNLPTTTSNCPTTLDPIVSRCNWGATASKSPLLASTPPFSNIVLHHTMSAACFTMNDCKKKVAGVQTAQMADTRYNGKDIAYNFLIGQDGNIYEGTGWTNQGQGLQSATWNADSCSIAFIGTFTSLLPNQQALDAYSSLITMGQTGKFAGMISSTYKLYSHKDIDCTLCPGGKFYQYIKTMPSYGGQVQQCQSYGWGIHPMR